MTQHVRLTQATFVAYGPNNGQVLTICLEPNETYESFLDDIARVRGVFLPYHGYEIDPTAFHYQVEDAQVIVHSIADDNLALLIECYFPSHEKRVQFMDALQGQPGYDAIRYNPQDNDYVEIDLTEGTTDILATHQRIVLLCTQ